MPTESCNVHGEPQPRVIADSPSTEAPRAELAADLSDLRPVALKSPTLLAENDPYNSVKSTVKIESADDETVAGEESSRKIDNRQPAETRADIRNQATESVKAGEDGKPVLRAIPVQPEPEETPVEIRRAVPVGPMDEVEEGALLKAATPAPTQSRDE